MNYVLWPIAHGVEVDVVGKDFAEPLILNVLSKLSPEEKGYLVPIPYNYTIRTNKRQEEMFRAVEEGLGNQELRRLKHALGSDVTWSFILAKNNGLCFFRDFCVDVSNIIGSNLSSHKGAKVICTGHSQGSQNFFSFFFEYPYKIDCFMSLGSPISMNSGAYDDWGEIPSNLGSWLNFYHDLDFVSSQLEGVHPSKEIAEFVKDYKVPTNLMNPMFWFPHLSVFGLDMRIISGFKAHCSYWTSDLVAEKHAEQIRLLMNGGSL